MGERINVSLGEGRSYEILVGPGLLAHASDAIAPRLRAPRCIIVTDDQVGPLYAPALEADLRTHGIACETLTLPAGEASKSFAQCEELMDRLLALRPDRKLTLIALGGGVIGDLTGFAASILLRGVAFIQIPTTLLAQVDSSVGGKTGINTKQGKNLIGSFYQPVLVLADTALLSSLPRREMLAGYAEILKYGLIADAPFYEWLLRHANEVLALEPEAIVRAVAASCRHKAAIVAADEREGGVRALLNFGHTFGHALEAELGYDGRLLHGEAVAIGMVMACRLSESLCGLPTEVGDRLAEHLCTLGMRVDVRSIAHDWSVERLIAHMRGDKKAEGHTLTFVLLEATGRARVQKNVAEAQVASVLIASGAH